MVKHSHSALYCKEPRLLKVRDGRANTVCMILVCPVLSQSLFIMEFPQDTILHPRHVKMLDWFWLPPAYFAFLSP